MPRFTNQNTEGYSANDLAALNAEFDRRIDEARDNGLWPDSIEYKSWQDSVAEGVPPAAARPAGTDS